MTWTTEIPSEDGAYWWKGYHDDTPQPVLLGIFCDIPSVYRCGMEEPMRGKHEITGLFWPEPIQPPV